MLWMLILILVSANYLSHTALLLEQALCYILDMI